MKKSIQALLALAAFGSASLLAHAQTAPKILVVDMNKLYTGDYKTQDQVKKVQGQEAAAQQQWDQMQKDLNAIKGQVDELMDQTKDPLATAEVKAKAQADAQKKAQDYQNKATEANNFRVNVSKEFQDTMQNFTAVVIDEISQKATAIAKTHGATLLLDKSLQTHSVIYSDPGYDITDEVLAAINKDAPAPAPAPATPATSSGPVPPAPTAAPAN